MNRDIVLKDSSNGDSRTCKDDVTLEDVYDAVLIHRSDVEHALKWFVEDLICRSEDHDYDKVSDIDTYGNMVVNGVKDDEFLASEWWHKHITEQRHHVTNYCPIDVNLLDILEMIADRVVAEKGRTGSINTEYLKIDSDILIRAYWNTVRLLDEHTKRL